MYHTVTLEDLLLCTAGIRPFTDGREKFPAIPPESIDPRYDFACWLLSQPPAATGENNKFRFCYSNAGYTLASLMLEKVTGKTYEELIEAFIVNELGIETFIGFPNRMSIAQPWGHTILKKHYEIYPPEHTYSVPPLITPAGDLSMKPSGFARFIQFHLKGLQGDNNFLRSDSYRYIHFCKKGFALGVFNTRAYGKTVSGMDGSAGTFFCRAIIIPESDFAFTIMTNAGTGTTNMKAIDWITARIAKSHYNWWWKFWM